MELIDKAAVVAEIERYISNYKEIVVKTDRNDSTWVDSVSMIDAKIDVLQHLLFSLDTLEVKEVNLDKDIRTYLTNHFNIYEDGVLQSKKSGLPLRTYDIIKVAEHFFELGLKAKKG